MKRFLAVLGAVLIALSAAALVLPGRIAVERSMIVNRPATTVFALLDGFVSWTEWSPWVARDPSATVTRSGPERGAGARLDWVGDPAKAGLGHQEILESDPEGYLRLRVVQGAQGEAKLEYVVSGDALGSRVAWIFETDVTTDEGFLGRLVGRYYGWFLARWVAKDFERGLQRFKTYAESLPGADFSQAEITRVKMAPTFVARVSDLQAATPEGVAEAVAEAFGAISAWALRHDVEFLGQPFIITNRIGPGLEIHEAAIPIDRGLPAPEEGVVRFGETPSGDAACVLHRGSTLTTLGSYEQLTAWVKVHGLELTGVSWEHYLSDPAATPASSASLEICVLVAGGTAG
jgi:effector-binding domain-containing protein